VDGERLAPAALPPTKTLDIHCTERRVSPGSGLDEWGKSRPPYRNAIPDRPARRVIQNIMTRETNFTALKTFLL